MFNKFIQIMILCSLFMAACTNPFTTRTDQVEKPVPQNGNVSYEPGLTSESVITNFKKAINNKNTEEYLLCLAPAGTGSGHNFRFEEESYFDAEFAAISWDLKEERSYFSNLIISPSTTYPKLNFSFINGDPVLTAINPSAPDDSVESANINYQLLVSHSMDSTAIYQGLMHIKLYKSRLSDRWYLYYWQDHALNNEYKKCWSYLKLYYQKNDKS